jgi:hypothetical protein
LDESILFCIVDVRAISRLYRHWPTIYVDESIAQSDEFVVAEIYFIHGTIRKTPVFGASGDGLVTTITAMEHESGQPPN